MHQKLFFQKNYFTQKLFSESYFTTIAQKLLFRKLYPNRSLIYNYVVVYYNRKLNNLQARTFIDEFVS